MSWQVDPALVALGDVSPADRERAEALLRSDPAFRAAVARRRELVDRVAALSVDDRTLESPPPALDLDRILAARPPRATRRPFSSFKVPALTLRPVTAAVCSLALLLAGGAIGTVVRGGSTEPAPTVASEPPGVRLLPFPGGGAPRGERASISLPGRSGGEVHLRVRGARPTPAGDVEEVWFMTDERRLVSIGTYRVGPGGTADVRFHTAADPGAYRYVDVSVEPTDGNPAHSGRSVLRSDV